MSTYGSCIAETLNKSSYCCLTLKLLEKVALACFSISHEYSTSGFIPSSFIYTTPEPIPVQNAPTFTVGFLQLILLTDSVLSS